MSDADRDRGPERVGFATRGIAWEEPLLFERSRPGRVGYSVPEPDVPAVDPASVFDASQLRDDERSP